jgi:hypothetical protein
MPKGAYYYSISFFYLISFSVYVSNLFNSL